MLGVASNHQRQLLGQGHAIASTAESVAQGLSLSDWKRLSAGNGAKGPRLYNWAELADIDAGDYGKAARGFGRAAF